MQEAKKAAFSPFNEGYAYFLEAIGTVCWAQEQAEALINKLAEQNRINRNDGMTVIKEIVEQTKKNQEKLQGLIYDGMNAYFSGYKSQIDELQKRVDELSKKIGKEK